ncbi:hypothetical protein Acr_27g0003900 [Actinidia rufa]|uniref:Uncharacterized protein n=1 Tax=Actinidia rufa TaxID=165716 RepID=A0A7J0H6J2_9ERIC|nr:hypothetical protein Acr_27g0003900 [Actinidia rufa]
MKKAMTKVRQGHREGCRRPRSDGKACWRLGEDTTRIVKSQRATVRLDRSQVSPIYLRLGENCRRSQIGDEAYWRSEKQQRSLSKVRQATRKPVRVKSTLDSLRSEVRRGHAKPLKLESNLDRSRSRTSDVRLPESISPRVGFASLKVAGG